MMPFSYSGSFKSRRRRTAGALLAIAAAAGASEASRADITNGFASFSPVNFFGQPSVGTIGYSGDKGTFTVTDARATESTSGFNPIPQNISSFIATFTYQNSAPALNTGTGSYGGITLTFQNVSAPAGTTALGGAYNGLGYAANAASGSNTGSINQGSAAFALAIGPTKGVGFRTNGLASTTYTSIIGKIPAASVVADPIQVTLQYYNNSLIANLVDLNTKTAYAQNFGTVNIQNFVGGANALIGITGSTGTAQLGTQNVSGFKFVSGPTFTPINVNGFNQRAIIPVGGSFAAGSIDATMDRGTNAIQTVGNNDTWYEQGYFPNYPTTGLPASGSTFTAGSFFTSATNFGNNASDTAHQFRMQNYANNDVVLVGPNTATNTAPTTATITLATPGAYSALSFLTASGNGPSSFSVVVKYADGAPDSNPISVISPDWFNGVPSAWLSAGRISPANTTTPDNANNSNPSLYTSDILLPNSTDPISSLVVTYGAGGNTMIMAVSGNAAANSNILVYNGDKIAGRFDNSTTNFKDGTGASAAFSNGSIVSFDDTAVDTAHNITVATVAGGLQVNGLIFNNTTATAPYNFSGAGLGGPGGLSVNGGGSVNIANVNTFSGDTQVNNGTLTILSGGVIASANLFVTSNGVLTVAAGGNLSSSALNLTDNGVVNFNNAARNLAVLNGSGVVNLNGTALTINGGSFAGTIGGPGGTGGSVAFNYSGGFIGSIQDGSSTPLSVTMLNSGSLAINGNSTYSGGTFLKAGVLQAGNNNAFGSGPLYFQGGAAGGSTASNLSSPVTVSNTWVFNQSTGLKFDAANPATFTGGGNVTLPTGSTPIVVTTKDSTSTKLQLSANFSDGAGPSSLNLTGYFALTGNNSYTGGTTVNAGTDVATNSNNGFGSGPIVFNGGGIGTLANATGQTFSNNYSFGATAVGYFENFNAFTMSGNGNLGAGAAVIVYVPSVNLSGVVSGGSLNLGAGSTVLELSGSSNTFAGPITLAATDATNGSGGTLMVDSPGAIGNTTAISVGSGASLLVNDNSGQLGLHNGTPITVTAVGPGVVAANTSVGAVRGRDGGSASFAGNIVTTGATTIAAGANGDLTLTGAITGTGPVTLTGNTSTTINLNGTGSNYGGETIVNGDSFFFSFTTVKIGVDNGFSPNAGLHVLTTNPGPLIVDLNGHNQSVAYLTGSARSSYVIQNTGGGVSTLTINNGNTSSGPASFATQIIDGGGQIALAKTGIGNQILTGNNQYTGGTTITAGTLTAAVSTAFGAGAVTLNGGTLALSAPQNPTGFSNFVTNGSASYNGSNLVLTTGLGNQAGSGYYNTPLTFASSGFTASFLYTFTPGAGGLADGITFNIQNSGNGPNALGMSGGGKGYNGINPSAALEFNNFAYSGPGGTAGNTGVAFTSNGANATTFNIANGISLGQSYATYEPIQVTVTYDGSTLTANLAGQTSGKTFTFSEPLNLASILGGNSGYIGFTGGTGGVASNQSISNFVYTAAAGISNAPVSIPNAVTAAANTSSTILISVTGGQSAASIGALTIQSGATVAVGSVGTLQSVRSVLTPSSLSIAQNGSGAFTGTLNVGRNDVVVPGGSLSDLTAAAASGFAANFTGKGITSSAAAADSTHTTAVGVILNNYNGSQLYGNGQPLGLFDGANPGSNDVLIKYTYFGDADLNGRVDGSDYSHIDFGFLTAGSTGWINGDFNYDNKVDGSDYSLIDNAYNRQGGQQVVSATSLLASPTALPAGTSAVPEPASVMVAAVGLTVLASRRRRA